MTINLRTAVVETRENGSSRSPSGTVRRRNWLL